MTRLKIVLVLVAAVLTAWGAIPLYEHRHFQVPVVAGPGVTRVEKLSRYAPGLKGTAADTDVFVLEGARPGGKALLLANTHANEPAGLLTAVIMIENAVVEQGTLYVIPEFNASAGRNTKPGDGYPLYFDIPTDWGPKRFRMGNRDASPLEQWPDPDVYIHYPEKQLLSFLDVRNTNRTWPGRADGPLMEKVTFAAMELLRREKVDVAVDMHGAETMFPVTNCIVAPVKSSKIATLVSMTVKAKEGFDNHVEPSPANFHGLSHREMATFPTLCPFSSRRRFRSSTSRPDLRP
jgi:predicted deacylase